MIGRKIMKKNEIKKMNETNCIEHKSPLTNELDLVKEVGQTIIEPVEERGAI